MATNQFLTNPVKVVIFDPMLGKNRHTQVFLGDVPKNIWNACNYYRTANASARSSYDAILREFYGSDFKSKLGLDIKDYSTAWIYMPDKIEIVGEYDPITKQELIESKTTYTHESSDIIDPVRELDAQLYSDNKFRNITGSADEDEIDEADIEALLNVMPTDTPARAAKVITSSVSAEELRAEFTYGIEYITDVQVYPEDKFSELKEKIYLSANIPAYRQHMFYIDRNRLRPVYRINADGLYNVDIRLLPNFKDTVHGIPIDKTLYDIRDSVRVEALDMFNILGNALSMDNVVYVVDLAQFTHKLHTQLSEIVSDTYQFELFYFGFIIKFWPQLTQECFYDYMISEPELQHKYPDLAKNKTALSITYKMEKEIITSNYRNAMRALSYARVAGITLAITQMIATVSGSRIMLNIRNLFDKLHVTRCIPEIHAYLEYNNKSYMLRKRHIRNGSDIQFPSGMLMKNGITIAISLRKSDQDIYHAKNAISTMENEQSRYLFLNIWPNGKYYVRTLWNEEDELGFDDIIKVMKKFTDPIINGINNLGKYVFIAGNYLPPITKQNINYQGLNICVFWKKVMLESTFKVIRSLWEAYMRARITAPRNVQQFDKYEFLFRKGMYEFDTSAIERIITASNNIVLTNHYAYLSNNTVKQKWDQNYDGRIVRMSHRTTDIRFEVSDIRQHEFDIFYQYIISFIYRAYTDANVKIALESTRSYKDVKKLRKLREQDPELYNLKKYGSKKVYSIICQNQRQPLIYTQDELRGLSAQEIKKLTQYWNFTLNKPAYYGCPNKKYPHLSFMVNAHPRHYCLPCCNKKPQIGEDSKKMKINSICLQKHKFYGTEPNIGDAGISRHVMNYGKDIDLGRLSKLPQTSIKNLLFNTIGDSALNYYLYGVAQHVPGVENIGIIYAISEAMGLQMEEMIKKLINELKKREWSSLFNTLLNGTLIEYFRSMEDLVISIKELFLDMKMFSKEFQRFKQWAELFTELMHIIFKISIFTFIDENGSGDAIDLFIPDILRNEIIYISKLAARDDESALVSSLVSEQVYLLIIKRQNHYYPIFVIDAEKYFKTFDIAARSYSYNDKVIKLIYSMVKYEARTEDLSVDKIIDLSLVRAFTLRHKTYHVVLKFINRQNLCYAVLVESPAGTAYLPTDYSVYISDGTPISFTAFNRADYAAKLHYSALMDLISQLNDFIRKEYSVGGSDQLYSYRLLVPRDYFGLPAVGAVTSGIIGLTTENNLMCYFTKYSIDELDPNLPVRTIGYDYNEVNRLITARAKPVEDNRMTRIGEALYNNYTYQLFVIEFVNYLNNERNQELRGKLKKLITDTNFKKDVSAFRREMRALLKQFPADYNILQNQLIGFYHTYFDKTSLLEQINTTVYDFDRVTMNRLKSLPRAEMKTELKKIAESFSVQRDFDSTGVKFPNIYMPCGEMSEQTGYCEGRKLIINRPMDDFVDILATDLMDELKSNYILNNIFMDVVVDQFSFARVPTEIITIYRLTE